MPPDRLFKWYIKIVRDKKQEFGEEDMRRWWREKDFSSVFNEKIITSDIDADSIVEMIYIAINEQI